MTDLDRTIAELKGWKYHPSGTLPKIRMGRAMAILPEGFTDDGDFHSAMNCSWSTSDSKALELVDELLDAHRNDNPAWEASISTWAWMDQGAWKWGWKVKIHTHGMSRGYLEETAPTRPEAICRAYIAAKEFLNRKGR